MGVTSDLVGERRMFRHGDMIFMARQPARLECEDNVGPETAKLCHQLLHHITVRRIDKRLRVTLGRVVSPPGVPVPQYNRFGNPQNLTRRTQLLMSDIAKGLRRSAAR